MTSQQAAAYAGTETRFGMRLLSDSECEAVSGGLLEPPSEEDDYWNGGFIERRILLSDETGEDIVITAILSNDGGGYCPTDSWVPNFIENLFDGDKYYFSGDGPFKYAMLGDNGTVCLYDQSGDLFGGYVSASSTDSYVMALTFTTNSTTGEISVAFSPPGGSVSSSSGTTGSSMAVTLFLAPVGQ